LNADKTRLALILSLALASQYFAFPGQCRPLFKLSPRPTETNTDSNSQAAGCIAHSESAKKRSTGSETANEIDRWQVAKNLLENLGDMKPGEIAKAFGIPEGIKRATFGIVYLGKGQQLRFSHHQLEFTLTNNHTDSIFSGGMHGSTRVGGGPLSFYSDHIYTGAKPEETAEYWTIIKANLDKFIGMSKANIIALMGPERCASHDESTIDYRVGEDQFRLYFTDDKVSELQLCKGVYDPPGTTYEN